MPPIVDPRGPPPRVEEVVDGARPGVEEVVHRARPRVEELVDEDPHHRERAAGPIGEEPEPPLPPPFFPHWGRPLPPLRGAS